MAKSRKVVINGQTFYADVFVKMGKEKAIAELKTSYKMSEADATKAYSEFEKAPAIATKKK